MKRICAVLLLLTAVACSKDGSLLATPTPTVVASRPASTGVLTIVSPQQGEAFPASSVPVKLRLTGARLIKETSTTITPDTGHIHIALDGSTIYIASGLGLRFDLADIKKSSQSNDRAPLTPGTHLLTFEFVAADHAPFNPRVKKDVTITIR